jgi:O-antigen ligase
VTAHRVLLVVVIVGTFLALGGMPEGTTVPILAASLALWAIAGARHPALGFTNTPLDRALVAVAVVVALQAVPLPAMVVDVVSPAADDLGARLVIGADQRSRTGWRPLTLDVNHTLAALATFVSALFVFVSTRSILQSGGTRLLCRTLAIVGAIAGVAALGFRLAAPELIYGIWRPEAAGAKPLGPFVNRNHFAGWLLLILPVAAGYFVAQFSSRLDHNRWKSSIRGAVHSRAATTAAAVFVMFVVLLLTASRSAWLGLTVAASLSWWLSRRRRAHPPGARLGTIAWGLAALLTALFLVNPDSLITRLAASVEDLPTGRAIIWRETLPIIRDFWATGTGAGTYGSAMTGYQQTWGYFSHLREFMHFNQAHNHYLHVAAEGGLLLMVPVLAAMVGAVRSLGQALREQSGETYWIRLGALTALVGIAVQSLFEVPLVAPANALLAAVVMAIGVHRREPRSLGAQAAPRSSGSPMSRPSGQT